MEAKGTVLNDSAKTKNVDQGKPVGLGAQKLSSLSEDAVPWLETSAEVIGCRYRFAGMSVLVFGIDTDHDHFMVSFSYYAHAQTFYDECASSKAMARGETFPIFYNPTNPKENNRFNPNT